MQSPRNLTVWHQLELISEDNVSNDNDGNFVMGRHGR